MALRQVRNGIIGASVAALFLAASVGASASPGPGAGAAAERTGGAGESVPHNDGAQPERASAAVPASQRDDVLGDGWETSMDLAWTVVGDPGGLRVLTARASAGYAWKNIATLTEPGFDTDRWIGNACLTSSGRRLVVAYAPRAFTNKPELNQRGAFTAVVDLRSGSVTKLRVNATLAYFSPSCGANDKAIITADGGERLRGTRLFEVDAGTGRVTAPVTVRGQLTSATPTENGIVAAGAGSILKIERSGAVRRLVPADGTPFDLRVTPDGGVAYLDHTSSAARLHTLSGWSIRKGGSGAGPRPSLAWGRLEESGLAKTRPGKVIMLGDLQPAGALPPGVQDLDRPAGTEVSVDGGLTWAPPSIPSGQGPSGIGDPTVVERAVSIKARSESTQHPVSFTAYPTSARTRQEVAASPSVTVGRPKVGAARSSTSSSTSPSASTTNPIEAERRCAVPRNDPRNQALQPTPRQVEWAADQAVRGALTVKRPANWKNLGMPAYTPQGLFPRGSLKGAGGYVPAQILLGILAQESNLWQAPGSVVPGVTGNPLIGNFYGLALYNDGREDDWVIRWSEADCGYGISQRTDNMTLSDKQLSYQTKRAVALDYAVNIAAGLEVLIDKWNQTRADGLIINDGKSSRIENWFYAVWAYNSGYHPRSLASSNRGAWGVGWVNNPANPAYPKSEAVPRVGLRRRCAPTGLALPGEGHRLGGLPDRGRVST